MIFVTVGNEHRQFKRMSSLVVTLSRLYAGDIIFQHGHTKKDEILSFCPNVHLIQFMPRDDFLENMQLANYFITHAGAGTLLQAAQNSIKPLVLARRKCYNEHLNDHQIDILTEFKEQNLCVDIDGMCGEDILKVDQKAIEYLISGENKLINNIISTVETYLYEN